MRSLTIGIVVTIIATVLIITLWPTTENIIYNDIKSLALGITGSLLVILFIETFSEYKKFKYFKLLEGEWNEYINEQSDFNFSKPTGIAVIKHIKKNSLRLIMTQLENQNKWVGDIFMSNEQHGTMAWSYQVQQNWMATKSIVIPVLRNEESVDFQYIYMSDINGLKTVLRRKK